jgi:site-specific DNA-methyltransferase (adenine-specific)
LRRTPTTNTLFYGDNLRILRDYIEDESVDLVYLDPPFNSNANYNVLFRSPTGESSQAQIEAFEDTWHWNETAERAFDEVINSGNSDAAEMLRAMRSFLKENDMMAYLAMMAVRLLELHRVLKPSGSLYLHCDPTASHYLKILLDAVFGKRRYINEIVWLRANAHNFKTRYWPRQHDIIFVYAKAENALINPQYEPYGPEQLSRYKTDENGRLYTGQDLTVSLVRRWRQFEWRGVTPPPHRSWGASREQLEEWLEEGRILLRKDGKPRLDGLKVYLDQTKGKQVGTVWDSIDRIKNTSGERLGYPTQKPLELLERIISASSNEGDLVLDPFCGCGTTVHAAQKLNRRWIGIDVTHLAIGLVRRRLIDAFPQVQFDVQGVPKDLGAAEELARQDKHQFQLWALSMIEAQPYKGGKKGADTGIDGFLYFKPDGKTTERAIVEVKGGENVSPQWVRALGQVVERERAKMGILLTLTDPTVTMRREAAGAGFYKTEYGTFPKIQILTIEDLFNDQKPHMPWIDPSVFKKARREKTETQGDLGI